MMIDDDNDVDMSAPPLLAIVCDGDGNDDESALLLMLPSSASC
jgi:hypothetical protein